MYLKLFAWCFSLYERRRLSLSDPLARNNIILHAKVARLTGSNWSERIQSGRRNGKFVWKQTRQLASTDRDVLWGFDAKPNAVALDSGHRDDDVVTDIDFF